MKPGMASLQHEAGDRAFVAAEHFTAFVQRHEFVASRPELVALAEAAGDALGALYQAIWHTDGADSE